MDYLSHKALSHVIEHENLSVIKQLRKELAKEQRAHKISRNEYESLLELIPTIKKYNPDCVPFLCPGCHHWLDLDTDMPLEYFFVFKRDLDDVLELKMIEVCLDCYCDLPYTCNNESVWLSMSAFARDETTTPFENFVDAYFTASKDELYMRHVAAIIIQHAFRHNWDWKNRDE